MTDDVMACCFNEWMRRYIDEPERFQREFQAVAEFLQAGANGQEPSYGQSSVAYMQQLARELTEAG